MLTYSFENIDTESMYEHLYRCIKQDILQKKLRAGEKLPSKRTFAKNLGVSTITVESAYAQLVAEGFLYTLPKRGYYVCELEREEPVAPLPPRPKGPAPREPDKRAYWADFVGSSVARDMFPFSVWVKLLRDVTAGEDEATLLTDTSAGGIRQLRQAISDHLYQFRGMTIDPEQIVVGAGAEYLYLLLAQLLGREAVFAVEDPGYPKIRQVYGKCGAACRPVPLDGQGVELSALERSGAKALHISPNHQYPTGLVTPIARRQALLRWAEDTGSTIIEDDYDSEFRFTGRPIPTLQSIDTAGRVVYMNTFSQTISPSMRVGFMVLPPRLLEQYRRELDFYSCTVPALDQHVLARFLDQGHYEQHLARMRKEYRTRHDAVLASFRSSPFRNRITISEQGAGLHFLLQLDTRESDGALRDRAAARGVRLGFLSEYAAIPSPAYAHTLVVNYAGLSPAALPEAMDLLAEIFGA